MNMDGRKYTPIPSVREMASLREIAQAMVDTNSYVVQVDSEAGKPLGWIDVLQLLKSLLASDNGGVIARDIYIPIEPADGLDGELTGEKIGAWYISRGRTLPYFFSREQGISGVFLLHEVMSELLGLREQETRKREKAEKSYQDLTEQVPLGIVICNGEGQVFYANTLARNLIKKLRLTPESLQNIACSNRTRVLKGEDDCYYNVTSRRLTVNAFGTPEGNAYLLLLTDVTSEYNLMKQLQNSREEAELALAVMLPDQRITTRLQSVVEYTDEYDPATGKIRITGVISQGVYRHVINILRLLAETFRQGLMELPGMEKNVLVTAAIFHDLAKVQPQLKMGEIVEPAEVFESGYLHAYRGAALAEGVYKLDPYTVMIIKYHHHEEEKLPSDFPQHLLPMYRFFRLIDGLSAGITRRNAAVKVTVKGSQISVVETNTVPRYNRAFSLELYTGKVSPGI